MNTRESIYAWYDRSCLVNWSFLMLWEDYMMVLWEVVRQRFSCLLKHVACSSVYLHYSCSELRMDVPPMKKVWIIVDFDRFPDHEVSSPLSLSHSLSLFVTPSLSLSYTHTYLYPLIITYTQTLTAYETLTHSLSLSLAPHPCASTLTNFPTLIYTRGHSHTHVLAHSITYPLTYPLTLRYTHKHFPPIFSLSHTHTYTESRTAHKRTFASTVTHISTHILLTHPNIPRHTIT